MGASRIDHRDVDIGSATTMEYYAGECCLIRSKEGPSRISGVGDARVTVESYMPSIGPSSSSSSYTPAPAPYRATASKVGPARSRTAASIDQLKSHTQPIKHNIVDTQQVAAKSNRKQHISEWLKGLDASSCLRNLDERIDVAASKGIAAGTFGEVRLATDNITKQQLAVKVIAMAHATEQDARKEVTILSKLDHPNIVKLWDVMIHRKQLPDTSRQAPYLCIVMDYVPNSYTIAKLILAMRLDINQDLIYIILAELASALGAMHAQGIVHRDVWSENVLLNGGSGSVMLVDFGSAELFKSGPDSVKCLNLPYMSPEASKSQRQGPGDDAWALGLLLSELLTGKFIKDRLKCSTKPIHFDTNQMGELLSDASAQDDMPDARLWRACKQLLKYDVKKRLTMTQLTAILECTASGSVETSAPTATVSIAAPSALTTARVASAVVSTSSAQRHQDSLPVSQLSTATSSLAVSPGVASNVVAAASLGYTPTVAQASFVVGQRIKYTSRTNGLKYVGRIVGRSSIGSATTWSISLDCGEKKDISEDNLWRLSPE